MIGNSENSNLRIILCTSYEQLLHFLMQIRTEKATRWALHSFNYAHCSKYVRRMTIQATEELLFHKLNSTICVLNAPFLYIHSYTKSSDLRQNYFFLHFWHIVLKHLITHCIQNYIWIMTSQNMCLVVFMVYTKPLLRLISTLLIWKKCFQLIQRRVKK